MLKIEIDQIQSPHKLAGKWTLEFVDRVNHLNTKMVFETREHALIEMAGILKYKYGIDVICK